jgi:hypothetical protein
MPLLNTEHALLKSCGNGALFFSLKGWDNIAQGNALGLTYEFLIIPA